MSSVTVMGEHLQFPHGKQLAMVLGAGALIGVVLLLRKGQTPSPVANSGVPIMTGADNSNAAEINQAIAEANNELAQITGANALEMKQAQYDYAIRAAQLPAYNRQCVPWDRWLALSASERNRQQGQIHNGKLVTTFTSYGVCQTPTTMGLGGHPPYVTQDVNQGFFSNSQSIRGPAGSFYPQTQNLGPTGFDQLVGDAFTAFLYSQGGFPSSGRQPVNRRNPYPYGGVPTDPYGGYYYA